MFSFLRQSAGFFIQIFAGVALCMIPFSEKCYRYPRKKLFIGFGIFAIVTSILFPLGLTSRIANWILSKPVFVDAYTFASANLYMAMVVAIFGIVYFRVIKEEQIKKLIVLSIVIYYAATQFMIVNIILAFLGEEGTQEVYSPLVFKLFVVTALVMFPIMAYVLRKVVREYLLEIEGRHMKRELGLLLTVTGCYFIVIFIYATISIPGMSDEVYWSAVMAPFILTAILLIVFFWLLFSEAVRRKRKEEQRHQLEIVQFQYKKIVQEMAQTKRIRHDMRHHLRHLSDLAKKSGDSDVREYISEIIKISTQSEDEQFCNNTIINGLLQYYVGWARSEGIVCKVVADCDMFNSSPTDLTALFGNVLENAIKSCMKVPEEKHIKINVGLIENALAIQVENSCIGVFLAKGYSNCGDFQGKDAFVSKEGDGGYGLENIELTAKKYGGSAKFKFDECRQIFITRIRLNVLE